ncbi:MAG: HAD family hydrolase [Desulfuromonadaceae bacterium]
MHYQVVMFDWGDTIMKDDPTLKTPMYKWPIVEAVDGAEEVLRTLHPQRTIVMATSAAQSDEADIRRALERVKLNSYFDHIFCFKNSRFRKPSEDFYRHIVKSLKVEPSDILMVGDNFEIDVQAANRVGIAAVWFNNRGEDEREGDGFRTIHSLSDLTALLSEDLTK